MTRNGKRVATVVIEAVVTHGRRGANFLFEVLQGAYEHGKDADALGVGQAALLARNSNEHAAIRRYV